MCFCCDLLLWMSVHQRPGEACNVNAPLWFSLFNVAVHSLMNYNHDSLQPWFFAMTILQCNMCCQHWLDHQDCWVAVMAHEGDSVPRGLEQQASQSLSSEPGPDSWYWLFTSTVMKTSILIISWHQILPMSWLGTICTCLVCYSSQWPTYHTCSQFETIQRHCQLLTHTSIVNWSPTQTRWHMCKYSHGTCNDSALHITLHHWPGK